MTFQRSFFVAMLMASWIWSAPAFAGGLELRNDVLASGRVVTVGDFFTHAGAASERPLFRAPRRGASGVVQAYRLVDALAALNIDWRPPTDMREIRIYRVSETVNSAAIASAIAKKIGIDRPEIAGSGEIDVRLDRSAQSIVIDGARQAVVTVENLNISDRRRGFRADLKITSATGRGTTVRRTVRGRFQITMSIPVLNRSVRRGDIITAADLTLRRQPTTARGDLIVDQVQIVGKAARRALPAGRPLRLADIQPPRIVRKNQLVTITYRIPGLVVSTKGRALRDGGRGDAIPVINIRSSKIVDATIQGPGLVSVNPAQPMTMAAR